MRWIVGVDAPRRSRGALQFARWLSGAMGDRRGPPFVPVRVLDFEHLRAALRRRHLDEVLEEERASLERQVGEVLSEGWAAPEVVQARTIAEGLAAACERHGAAGIVVARAAPRQSHRLFRLSGVARDLLRALASPVLVVPSDLTAPGVGAGPVIAASSLAADSVAACQLARSIADEAHRELTIVHVARDPGAESAGSGSPAPREAPAAVFAERDRALAGWVARHGVWPDVTAVLEGDVATATVAFAEARHAPLVVVGAHPSGGLASALEPKRWRWIAAHARQAVLVVPASPAGVAAEASVTHPGREDPMPADGG